MEHVPTFRHSEKKIVWKFSGESLRKLHLFWKIPQIVDEPNGKFFQETASANLRIFYELQIYFIFIRSDMQFDFSPHVRSD